MTDTLLSVLLVGTAVVLVVSAAIVCYRIVVGPSTQDRVIALNIVGTNTAVAVALLAIVFDEPGFVDVAIAYGLLNFVASIALARLTATGGELTWTG